MGFSKVLTLIRNGMIVIISHSLFRSDSIFTPKNGKIKKRLWCGTECRITRQMMAKKETSKENIRDMTDVFEPFKHLWASCENCETPIYKQYAQNNKYICQYCDFHIRMESSDRLDLLIDPGTWDPKDENIVSIDPYEILRNKKICNQQDEERKKAEISENNDKLKNWIELVSEDLMIVVREDEDEDEEYESSTEASFTEESFTEKSFTEESSTEKSFTEEFSTEEFSTDKFIEESSTEKSFTEEFSTEQSSTDKLTEESSTEKSFTEEFSTKESYTEESSTEESSTEKSTAEEPIIKIYTFKAFLQEHILDQVELSKKLEEKNDDEDAELDTEKEPDIPYVDKVDSNQRETGLTDEENNLVFADEDADVYDEKADQEAGAYKADEDAELNKEKEPDIPYVDKVDSNQRKTGLTDAVQTGIGELDHIPLAIAVMDFEFIGGSMGSVVGEKITRLIEYAAKKSLPLIISCASGGARMQEGSLSLIQMAKISSVLLDYQLTKNLFLVSILTTPTTGGVTASFGMLGNIIIGEPDAYIAFAGKIVIEEVMKIIVPEGVQEAEYLFEKGSLDSIVPRFLIKGVLSELLRFHGFFPKDRNTLP